MKLFLPCYFVLLKVLTAENGMVEIFRWKVIDYEYAEPKDRLLAIERGDFISKNNVPFGVERWTNKLFVTVPRREPGIPSTLNYVKLDSEESSPLLIPYPDWESNEIPDGNITSVYRINVDVCNRLWIVDTGSVKNFEGEGVRIHASNIQIFDLNTDTLLRKHVIGTQHVKCDSAFTNIIADVTENACDEAFAYVTDPGSNTLLVYSYKDDDSWRIKHPYFHIDPLSSDFQIGGLSFQWDDGIFGIALSSIDKSTGFRTLFFHPMSSTLEFAVSTEYLRNKTVSNNSYHRYKILGSRGTGGQSSASSYDMKEGIFFYPLINKNSIACWNTIKYLNNYSGNTTDIIFQDNTKLIYASDIKVDKESNLWVISNRLPINLYGTMNFEDINYRVFNNSVKDIIKGTVCENRRGFWSKIKNR